MSTAATPEHCTSFHGVMLEVLGMGIILKGISGIGKSELALGLVNRGHHLIADDSVWLCQKDGQIEGSCPEILQDFLEVRGLGILNIRAMFGDEAIKHTQKLELVVNIINISNEELRHIDRLQGMHKMLDIMGVVIPEVSIPVAPGRNLAILVEGAVRNQLLKQNGYDAGAEFINKQRELLEKRSL